MSAEKRGIHILCMVGVLLVLTIVALPVSATGGAVVAIDPPEVTVPLGNQVGLQLQVRNGDNVNAFDLTLTYNPDRVFLDSWEHGGYLSNLNCLRQINQPGRLELACTQIATGAVSGDGILLNLVFESLSEGTTEVRIQHALLANPQGGTVQPVRQHGTVTVALLPTYTPTRTPTRTATLIPTRTQTPIASPTATVSPVEATTALPGQVNTPGAAEPTLDHGLTGITRTITTTPILDWPPTQTAVPAENDSTPVVVGEVLEVSETETPDSTDHGTVEMQESRSQQEAFLEIALWVMLGLSLILMIVVMIVLIQRKKKKDDNYLL